LCPFPSHKPIDEGLHVLKDDAPDGDADDDRELLMFGGECVEIVTCSPDCYQSEVESGSFMMVD
jgi:hypothetical protein